ncbi:MAG TPA: hypothetical protein ENI61_06690 [Ignavibacteria bacterium]|nr:hypothetical protein [Ignavibacteria bacterium]
MREQISLSGSIAWYSIGSLFIRSFSFLLLPLYSNLISTGEFGDYALIMSLYAIISVFYQAGMQSGLTKFYLEEKTTGKRREIFSTILNFLVISGAILTIVIIFFSKEISFAVLNSIKYDELINLIFLSLFIETLGNFCLHLLKTKEAPRSVVIYSSIAGTANLIFNIILVYFLKLSIKGIILSQLFASFLLLLIVLPMVKKNYIFTIKKNILNQIIKFSYPLIFAGLLSAAVDFSDRFILNHFLNSAEVGIYSFSYRIAMIMFLFVIAFRTAWMPRAINLYGKGKYEISFGNTFNKLLAVSFMILLTVSLMADYLFKFRIGNFHFFNLQYESGVVIIPFILVGYLFAGISSFFSVYPFISGKSKHFLVSDMLAFVFNIILNFWLIPIYGLLGAAFATTISLMLSAIYLFIVSKDKIKIYYDIKEIVLLTVTALLFLIIGLQLKEFILDIFLLMLYLGIIQFFTKIKLNKSITLI